MAEAGQPAEDSPPVAPLKRIPGVTPRMPGPDDLSPAQVEILLKRDRRAFEAFAQKLTDAALVALKAVDTKNVDGLYEAGDAIDQACENCHLNYWYPGSEFAGAKEPEVNRATITARADRSTNRRPATDHPPSRSN